MCSTPQSAPTARRRGALHKRSVGGLHSDCTLTDCTLTDCILTDCTLRDCTLIGSAAVACAFVACGRKHSSGLVLLQVGVEHGSDMRMQGWRLPAPHCPSPPPTLHSPCPLPPFLPLPLSPHSNPLLSSFSSSLILFLLPILCLLFFFLPLLSGLESRRTAIHFRHDAISVPLTE